MLLAIKIYWAIGIASIVVYLIIHYFEIVPLLQKHNIAGPLTWLTNIRHDEDLKRYKELCLKENKALFWYQVISNVNKYTIIYLIGWFLSLFLGFFWID